LEVIVILPTPLLDLTIVGLDILEKGDKIYHLHPRLLEPRSKIQLGLHTVVTYNNIILALIILEATVAAGPHQYHLARGVGGEEADGINATE
jgi:hypothetical protein